MEAVPAWLRKLYSRNLSNQRMLQLPKTLAVRGLMRREEITLKESGPNPVCKNYLPILLGSSPFETLVCVALCADMTGKSHVAATDSSARQVSRAQADSKPRNWSSTSLQSTQPISHTIQAPLQKLSGSHKEFLDSQTPIRLLENEERGGEREGQQAKSYREDT